MIGTLLTSLALANTLTLPVRVDGEGYLRFVRDGRIVYATSADLTVQTGALGFKGLPVTPYIHIPANAIRLEVDLSGNVVAVAGTAKTTCGRLVLARFDSKPTADQGFLVSATRATIGNPGEGVFGVIRSSNNAAPQAQGEGSIAVRKLTEVEGDSVTLGDIAEISGDPATKKGLQAVVFGPAPAVGLDVPVTRGRIQALLKRVGMNAEVDVPAAATIRRKAQTIKQEEFIAAATKAAQEELGAEVPMTCSDQQGDFKAPFGTVELKTKGISTSGTNVSVVIGVHVEGKYVNSRTVNLKPDSSGQIRAGTAIKISMKSAGLTVEVNGKARTGGIVGQTITVVTDTGSVLTGVVVAADRVEVKI
jgi:hypothetical protein